VTIPTTNKAITDTPANTPRPIGNTSNFFPGGSKGVGDGVGDSWPKGVDAVGDGRVSGREFVFPGGGGSVGLGTEEVPITSTGPLLVLLGGGDAVSLG